MKKFFIGLLVLGTLLVGTPTYASTISDLQNEVSDLKQQILDLKSKLVGAVASSTLPDITSEMTLYPKTSLTLGDFYEFEQDINISNPSGSTIAYNSYYNHFEFKNPSGTIVSSGYSLADDGVSGTGSTFTNYTYTPTVAGTWYVRGCVDQYSATNTTGLISESDETNNCSDWVSFTVVAKTTTTTSSGVPNLKAEIYSNVATFSSSTYSFVLSALIRNSGSAAATGFYNHFEVSKDKSTIIGNVSSNTKLSLIASATSTITGTYYPVSAGTYYFRACADQYSSSNTTGTITESSETDNCSSWSSGFTSSSIPNISIDDFTVTYPSVTAEVTSSKVSQKLQLTGYVDDSGYSGNFWTHFEISKDKSTVISNIPVWTYTSDRTYTGYYTPTTSGTYYFRVCADQYSSSVTGGSVVESDETDNCSSWSSVSVGTTASTNLTATLSSLSNSDLVVLKNYLIELDGDVSGDDGISDTFYNHYEISKDQSTILENVGVGDTSGSSVDYTISSDLDTGLYYVRFCADQYSSTNTTGTITETSETDNCSSWRSFIVIDSSISDYASKISTSSVANSSSLPDLWSTVTIPSSVQVGTTNYFGLNTANSTKYTLSNSGFYSHLEIKNSSGTVSNYASSSTSNGSGWLTYAPYYQTQSLGITFSSSGTYSVRACADQYSSSTTTSKVSEYSESNNCSDWTSFTVSANSTTGSTTNYAKKIAYGLSTSDKKLSQYISSSTGKWVYPKNYTYNASYDKLTFCKIWYPNTTSVSTTYTTQTLPYYYTYSNSAYGGHSSGSFRIYTCVQ